MAEKRINSLRMTEGSELRSILTFMLPLLAGNIFQQFYNFVDSVVVGRFVGAQALGSVGAVGSVSSLFLALCIGLAGGVNVLTAQYFRSGNMENVKYAIANSIYVTAGAGILMSVISVCFAPLILSWMQVPEQNFSEALTYMRIVCGAMLITAFYNTISQILRGLGDAATPLYYVIGASVINVVLDLVFVAVFHWGVAGAGLGHCDRSVFCHGRVCCNSVAENPPVPPERKTSPDPGKDHKIYLQNGNTSGSAERNEFFCRSHYAGSGQFLWQYGHDSLYGVRKSGAAGDSALWQPGRISCDFFRSECGSRKI